jgi:N-acetylmuramoyl-L-alanine amidase
MRILGMLLLLAFVMSSCQNLKSTKAVLDDSLGGRRPLVIIDPGHGGKNLGAHSSKYQYAEKNFALMTSLMLKDHLEKLGYNVVVTRYSDYFITLQKRAEIANDMRADIFVSIHYNSASNKSAHGLEVFYTLDKKDPIRTKESKELAAKILQGMLATTGAKNRGVKEANLAVTRLTEMPAVLVEGGFLSNANERARLRDTSYLNRIAWGVAKGFHQYMR